MEMHCVWPSAILYVMEQLGFQVVGGSYRYSGNLLFHLI